MTVGRNLWKFPVSVRGVSSKTHFPVFKRMSARLGLSVAVASLVILGAGAAMKPAIADSDTRTLSFLHLHTKESITVTFKRNGRFDDAGLKKLNRFLRDWRRDEETTMDPKLFDILWEVYREVGGQQPIEIISAYRAPGTNQMLRARSSGVAENSNHTHGQAIDFEIPGVPLAKIREIGLRLQRGGVGFYPSSGSPFVHLDTGTIRHWPRMTRDQLTRVFPDGRTVHIPSDGQPLANYALALADVQRRGNAPSGVIMAQAREAGVSETVSDATPGRSGNLLAAFFGGRPTAEEPSADEAPQTRPAVVLASARSNTLPKPVATAEIVPLPSARPKPIQVAQAEQAGPNGAPNVMAARGSHMWANAVDSGDLAPAATQSPFTFADTMTTASTQALGYAAAPTVETRLPLSRPAKAPPMGANIPAAPAILAASTTRNVAAVEALTYELSGGAGRADSPWLRAAMLTPNASTHMTTSYLGARDMLSLTGLFQKPAQALVMTFSADPSDGLLAERFSGKAVTFLATASFTPQTTASLR